MAGPPLGTDVIHHQGAPQPGDRASFEAVPGVGSGDEDQCAVEVAGHPCGQLPFVVVHVGAPAVRTAAGGQVDQDGDALGADIGMRFKPETVAVAAELDAERGAGQIDAAQPFPSVHHLCRLHCLGDRPHCRQAQLAVRIEEQARAVVGFAAAGTQVERGRQIERQLRQA